MAGLLYLLFQKIKEISLTKEILFRLFLTIYHNFYFLFFAIILLVVNYGLELKKWQLLTISFEKRTSKQALGDILHGLMAGLFTPFMIGDFLGRSLGFKLRNRSLAIASNFFNSMAQTLTSIFLGTCALCIWYVIYEVPYKKWLLVILIVMSLATILGLFFILKLNISWDFVKKINFLKKFTKRTVTELDIENVLRIKILGFSVLRNLVFFLQFYLVLLAFGLQIPFDLAFIGINFIFLLKTVGGGLNILGDLSIRELVGINFFGYYNYDPTSILMATFLVWFLNIFLPVLFVIINPRFFKR